MSTKSTIYDIGIMYRMDDKASAGLAALGRNADAAEQRTVGLKEAILGVGAALGVGFLAREGKEAFVTFNSNVEQAKLGIASISKMFNKDMSFDQALGRSDKLFEFYQEQAKKSTGTTMDFINMHKSIAPALEKAGASVNDFKKITTGATVTAPLFGERADVVALDIKQMMMGTVGARDRVASTLISMMGMGVAEFNAKVKSDPKFGLDFLTKAFDNPALQAARVKMEHTFEGALSTLKDNVEIEMGKAGKPLFDVLSKTLNDVNAWVDQHPKEILEWSHALSDNLMGGFGAAKGALNFVVQHKDVLLHLSEAFLLLKGVGIVGGNISSGVGGLADSIMGLTRASVSTEKGFNAFMGNLSTAATALGGLYLAATVFADWVDSKHKEFTVGQGDNNAMIDAINTATLKMPMARTMMSARGDGTERGAAAMLRQQGRQDADQVLGTFVETMHQWGAFTKDANVDWQKFHDKGMQMGLNAEAFEKLGPLVDEAFKRFATDGSIMRRLGLSSSEDKFDADGSKRRKSEKTNVNVTIHKVEVASPDPDRFAFGMDKAFRKLAQNPTAAVDALRGGT